MMKFTLQLVTENESGNKHTDEILKLDKTNQPSYCLGLSLLESKQLLQTLQQKILVAEVNQYLESQKSCPCCQHKRRIKGHETFQYRTLFGTVVLPNLRLYNCGCDNAHGKIYSVLNDWLKEHNSPELQYIETKWASHLSYHKASSLLQDLLPIHLTHNAVTVRSHLHKAIQKQEKELETVSLEVSGCENMLAQLPKPDKPLVVGSDGGYVRSCYDKHKNFEVIVGRVYSKTKSAKRFGFVQSIDKKPQHRLVDTLKKQGLQGNQQITFLSDGAENVRDLQFIFHPEAEHVLDWFHITMRLTVLKQFSKGFLKSNPEEGKERQVASLAWEL